MNSKLATAGVLILIPVIWQCQNRNQCKENIIYARQIVDNKKVDTMNRVLYALTLCDDSISIDYHKKLDYFVCALIYEMNLPNGFSGQIKFIMEDEMTKEFDVGYGGTDAENLEGKARFIAGYIWENGKIIYKVNTQQRYVYFKNTSHFLNRYKEKPVFIDSIFSEPYLDMK